MKDEETFHEFIYQVVDDTANGKHSTSIAIMLIDEAVKKHIENYNQSLIADIEKRIEELRKEYNKFYFEEDAEIRAQILITISELQLLLKTARE